MPHKNANINIAYHFLAEAMIIFLFAVPFMRGEYHWVPYWGYLAMVVGICIIYSIYTAYEKSLAWYITTAPVLIILFFVAGYSFLLSLAFPILLTYRYIFLRKDTMLNREAKYINLTVALSILLLIWIKDLELIIYPFLLLVLLLMGNIYSHFYVLGKRERRGAKGELWIILGSMVGIGAFGLYFIFNVRHVFTMIWDGIMGVYGYAAQKLAMLVGFFFPDPELPEEMKEKFEEEGGPEGKDLNEIMPEQNSSSAIEDYDYLVFWAIGIIILGVVLIMAIRYFRSRFNPIADSKRQESTDYSSLDKDDYEARKRSLFKRLFKAPDNKVRKLVYQFERDAKKADVGRYSYETLDKWMDRLGFDIDMTTYKKVRYGDINKVSEEEVQTLKEHLQTIRNSLKGKSD